MSLVVTADVLFLANQMFFAITFVVVARRALHERRRSDLDVALLFGVMAVLLITPRVAAAAGLPSPARMILVTPLILAVPYLMLRLVGDFAAVPGWALRTAEAAFIGQIVVFAFQGMLPLWAVAVYAAIPLAWSSIAFVREAHGTRGVASRRYLVIAVGNAAAVVCLALVAAVAVLQLTGDAAAVSAAVLQFGVLAAGVCYFAGFATPRWLRRLWREGELRSFIARAAELIALPDSDRVIRQLAFAARDAMGFDGVLIGLPVGAGDRLFFRGTGADDEARLDETFSGRAIRAKRALASFDPIRDVPARAQLYRERNAKMIVAAPMRVGDEIIGALSARRSNASLFANDDLELCQLLADQAAIVLHTRRLIEQREFEAEHDPLTLLPNSRLLYRRLEERIANPLQSPLALLLLDLDAFAEVNQTFGHVPGDELLVGIAQRLAGAVLEGAVLGRWSGDSFAVIAPGGRATAEGVASRLLKAFEQPFALLQEELECGASVGVAVHPDHAADARGLVAAADLALGLAKRAANTYAVYPLEVRPQQTRRLALRADLRRAIRDDALRLEYQPLVSLRSGGLLRLEALVRWDHPQRGAIPPAEFVELAERTALIRPLTERVLHHALSDASEWRRWLPHLRVAVNVSARMFADAALADVIVAMARASGCALDGLTLEITESILMTEPERARHTIARLRELGITTEIDDFGTGYSSLAYLQRLPVSGLKIDRQFIGVLTRDERSDAIVRATIRLAHELGFEVVAEGIADRESWDLLAASGCDTGQGYYIAQPMPASAVREWLRAWLARAPAAVPRAAGASPTGARRLVLVVDDDPAIVSVIRDVLTDDGNAVVTASNGEEALELVGQQTPDAVLLDVHMPLFDGAAFVDAIRQRGLRPPMIVMTAGPNAQRWAERLGAEAFLPKPFSVDALLAVTRDVTGPGPLARR